MNYEIWEYKYKPNLTIELVFVLLIENSIMVCFTYVFLLLFEPFSFYTTAPSTSVALEYSTLTSSCLAYWCMVSVKVVKFVFIKQKSYYYCKIDCSSEAIRRNHHILFADFSLSLSLFISKQYSDTCKPKFLLSFLTCTHSIIFWNQMSLTRLLSARICQVKEDLFIRDKTFEV